MKQAKGTAEERQLEIAPRKPMEMVGICAKIWALKSFGHIGHKRSNRKIIEGIS